MIKTIEQRLLRWLKVPPEPAPPAGAPGSLQVFRAGRNYMRLKLIAWFGAQLAAVWGILVSLYFIREVEYQMMLDEQAAEQAAEQVEGAEAPPTLVEIEPGVYVTEGKEQPAGLDAESVARDLVGGEERRRDLFHRLLGHFVPQGVYEVAKRTPPKIFFWIKVAETIGIVVFVVQFFWSLFAVWLDYTQRWYMVTDRSLRLRWGVVKIHESTMSFANLQQVTVKQGPVQRLLKLADVEVQSAGGGSGSEMEQEKDSMHRSTFHAVENASEIRDLILARLQRFRQSGLGEPDEEEDHQHDHDHDGESEPTAEAPVWGETGGGGAVSATTVEAARWMLEEIKAARAQLGSGRD
jgi:membrane protein YdbS with pleckstrin-like domain